MSTILIFILPKRKWKVPQTDWQYHTTQKQYRIDKHCRLCSANLQFNHRWKQDFNSIAKCINSSFQSDWIKFALFCHYKLILWREIWDGRQCPGSIPGAGHLFRYVTDQPLKANSAFHPSGVRKWVPALAGKAKAGHTWAP